MLPFVTGITLIDMPHKDDSIAMHVRFLAAPNTANNKCTVQILHKFLPVWPMQCLEGDLH